MHLHHVEGLVESLFFGKEHFVNIDGRNVIALLVVRVQLVEHDQLLLQRSLRLLVDLPRVVDALRDLVDLVADLVLLWHFISVSVERIADSKNLVSD